MIKLKILEEVVANHLCTECGACVGVCPPVALAMEETPGGQVLPVLTPSLCTECGLCDLICPEIDLSEKLAGELRKPFTGPVLEAYLAEATSADVAYEGQTGGMGRALLAWALESGRVSGVVCVVDDPGRPLRPRAVIAETPEEVLASSRSKYCPVPVNALIGDMLKFDGRLAYVGLSCHMQGLQLVMDRIAKLRNKIALRIGLFCDRVLTFHAADFHARCAGIRSEDEISQFDYRHKEWQGWPGDIRVVTQDDRVKKAARIRRTGSKPFFTCTHCLVCPDKLNILADISLGDPYGVAHGRHVPTAAIVRTEAGRAFLRDAEQAGCIKLEPTDGEAVAKGQRIAKHVEDTLACGREMLHRGSKLPVFLQTGGLAVEGKGRRPLWARLAIWWGIRSQTGWGVWVARHLPIWAPVLWSWLRQRLWASLRRAGRVCYRLLTSGRLRRRPQTAR